MKGKFYKIIMRLSMMYVFKCYALNRKNKIKIKVLGIIMVRWMCNVTKYSRIKNEYIRESLWATNNRK